MCLEISNADLADRPLTLKLDLAMSTSYYQLVYLRHCHLSVAVLYIHRRSH